MPQPDHGEAEADVRVVRALRLAVELSIVVLAVEAFTAIGSHSLALSTDAVHNVPDVLAFAISYLALREVGGGPSGESFVRHRREVFAGLANAALVLATGVGFGYAALATLSRGGSFDGTVVLSWLFAGAITALLLRAVSFVVLARLPGRVRDLNFRSVLLHLGTDVAVTVTILAVGVLLWVRPTLTVADPAASLAIAALLIAESVPLFREASDVLTERTPRHLDLEAVERTALAVPGVKELHDVHIWAACPTLICMTAHVGVEEMTVGRSMDVVAELQDAVRTQHGILHSVFQVEADRPVRG
jgi:cobalt-zinc-cadmium efflux system protein